MGIACVQFDAFEVGPLVPWTEGPTKIYRFGYFWWRLGGYNFPLEHVRFAKQIFLPPTPLVTGYGYDIKHGVHGQFVHTYTKLDELPLDIIGEGVNLAIGQVAGLKRLGLSGLEGPEPTLRKLGTNQRLKGGVSR